LTFSLKDKFTAQLMQENATLKALNVELDRKIKDYEGRTATSTGNVPATTPRGLVVSSSSSSSSVEIPQLQNITAIVFSMFNEDTDKLTLYS
jgi:hypothetical protein